MLRVRDIQDMDLQFISDSQDVAPLNEQFDAKYDSYFVDMEQHIAYGMFGIIPYLEKMVFNIHDNLELGIGRDWD